MHIMSFSERMYFHVPEDQIINNQNSYFGIPNKYFDPQTRRSAHERVSG